MIASSEVVSDRTIGFGTQTRKWVATLQQEETKLHVTA